jgi:hypothetical protein
MKNGNIPWAVLVFAILLAALASGAYPHSRFLSGVLAAFSGSAFFMFPFLLTAR